MKWELTVGNDLTSPLIPPVTSPQISLIVTAGWISL